MKYYLIVDDSTQWFGYIVAQYPDAVENKCAECFSLESRIGGPFVNQIYSREVHFTSRRFSHHNLVSQSGGTFYGWTLSKSEFDRLKELIDLYPAAEKYNKLINLYHV